VLSSALLLGACVLAILAPRIEGHQVRALDGKLRALIDKNDRAGFRKLLAMAVHLHPSEPVLALTAAAENIRHRDVGAGPWLSRAMQLAPGWPAPHILAYRWLWQHGKRAQSLSELQAASELDPRSTAQEACALAHFVGKLVLRVAPRDQRRQEYLEKLVACVYAGDPKAPEIDEALLEEFPASAIGNERRAARMYGEGHPEEALALVDAVLARDHASDGQAHVLRAQILFAAGRYEESAKETETSLPLLDTAQRRTALETQALAYAREGREDAVERTVHIARRLAGTDTKSLAESYALEGRALMEMKNSGEAFRAYREAYRINSDTQYLELIGALAGRLGDRAEAIWAYINLCQRLPTRREFCAARDSLLAPPSPNSER
jgi:tetratricopeptide (TPR) repeat protein